MSLKCENFVKKFLPAFRSLLVKELIEKYKFSQVEAAAKLGVTQAAISQYFHLKRGRKIKEWEKLELFKPMIEETARKIAENKTVELDNEFCKFCKALMERNKC
ncbi:MAG: helix-turn-helix domain-containing protein [Candidatus Bathyarchaeia archaeon]